MSDIASEPRPEDFTGSGLASRTRRLLGATRPKFFTASALPVLVGFAWGHHAGGSVDPIVFLLAILATVAVHAGSNVFNDVGDDINGSDAANDARIHPFTGGSRFIQNGILTRQQMLNFSIALFVLGAIFGGALIAIKGITVLWLGLAGIALGVFYSIPGVQLMARGIGELSIAVAFGLVPVSGAAWLATGQFEAPAIWLAAAVGLWVAAILQVNEVPDMAADAAAGKRTMAVRIGVRNVAILYFMMQLVPFLIFSLLVLRNEVSAWILVLPALLVLLGLRAALGIASAKREDIMISIKITLAIQALGCLWLIVFLAVT